MCDYFAKKIKRRDFCCRIAYQIFLIFPANKKSRFSFFIFFLKNSAHKKNRLFRKMKSLF